MPKFFLVLLFISAGCRLVAQTVYKTPSGKKYHTATCRYVKNVSEKLTKKEADKLGLEPCSQCIKVNVSSTKQSYGSSLGIKPGEAKGEHTSQQCRSMTKAKQRCKRMTKNVNGLCFQHE